MRPHFVIILLLIVASVTSLWILPQWRWPVLGHNIFIPILLLILLSGNAAVAAWAALSVGFITDLLSAAPFGTYTTAYLIGVVLCWWVSRSRFTNRSYAAYVTLTVFGFVAITLTALVVSFIGHILLPTSISVNFGRTWTTELGFGALRAAGFATLSYLLLRIFGRSYTTLMNRAF